MPVWLPSEAYMVLRNSRAFQLITRQVWGRIRMLRGALAHAGCPDEGVPLFDEVI